MYDPRVAGDRPCRSRRAPLKPPREMRRRCCRAPTDTSPLAGARHAPHHARFAALRPRARRVLEVRTAARALFRLVAQAQAHTAHACRAHCVARWLSRQLLNITSWHFVVTFAQKISDASSSTDVNAVLATHGALSQLRPQFPLPILPSGVASSKVLLDSPPRLRSAEGPAHSGQWLRAPTGQASASSLADATSAYCTTSSTQCS